jgi:predicted ABC-type ATPase
LEQADHALLFDNSGAQPRLIGEKQAGVVTIDVDALVVIVEAANKIRSE